MFSLIESFEIDTKILRCDYFRYIPPSLPTIQETISQTFIDIPRDDSVISLKDSVLKLGFELFILGFDVLNAANGR